MQFAHADRNHDGEPDIDELAAFVHAISCPPVRIESEMQELAGRARLMDELMEDGVYVAQVTLASPPFVTPIVALNCLVPSLLRGR
jgi:hypothetical protein